MIPVMQLAADTVEDNSSYAEGFLRDLYGSQIDIYVDENKPSGYTETYLLETPNADVYSYGKISSVSYEIIGDTYNTYEIVGANYLTNYSQYLITSFNGK